MSKKIFPLIVILVLAFAFRIHDLADTPPGLTHDEANHGRDSMNILDGVLLFYFPLNYGSEPLYNYVVAGTMSIVGENILSLRLVNVMAGLLLIAAMYLWTSWAFDRRMAVVAAVLVAFSFWPVAVSRQALRAGLLPLLTTTAVIFFWLMLEKGQSAAESRSKWDIGWGATAGFAVSIAAALHTYLAARVIWLLFPIFLVYLLIFHRSLFRRTWRPAMIGLAAAGLLVVPMFAYVNAHPEAETRLEMLDGPIQNITAGEFKPVLENGRDALLAYFWPGFGDTFLAYNIPGRPLFGFISAAFFLAGLVLCLWRWRRPSYAFLIIWFFVGIVPSLITGPTANTTRNIAALPPTYLLPAVGYLALYKEAADRWGRTGRRTAVGIGLVWITAVAIVTYRDYFVRWAEDPNVRAAYQQTLVQSLEYLRHSQTDGPVVLSSVYPGAAHDPSIARVLMPDSRERFRWIDGRLAMLFPAGKNAQLIVPSSTPLHPVLDRFTTRAEAIFLRPDDLDPSFTAYDLLFDLDFQEANRVNFGDGLNLLDAKWVTDTVSPGNVAELISFWEVIDSASVGPRVPPAFETDVVLFSHVLNDNGDILAQRDSLEAPSWSWKAGDIFIQIHPLPIPVETEPGTYKVVVGVYDRESGVRLDVLDANGVSTGTAASVVPLSVK